MSPGTCELCGRTVALLTRHHLIPRTRHANKKTRRTFGREEVHDRVAHFCKPCHKQLHSLFDEKELERELNTLEALRAHAEVARFVAWIRTKPDGTAVPSYRAARRAKTRRRGPR